jgi:hypothetical protein
MENVGGLITCDTGPHAEAYTPNQIALAHRIMGRPYAALPLTVAVAKSYTPSKGENARTEDVTSIWRLFCNRDIQDVRDRQQLLTDAQVELECNELRARGALSARCLALEDRREALYMHDTEALNRYQHGGPSSIISHSTGSIAAMKAFHFEAASARNVICGSSDATFFAAPALGPVCIPVRVSGRPVYAFLSTVSQVTVVSKDFADRIGLRYVRLRTSKSPLQFTLEPGPVDCSLIPRLLVTLPGGLDVTLTTAVVVPNARARGIQLGHDFFAASLR